MVDPIDTITAAAKYNPMSRSFPLVRRNTVSLLTCFIAVATASATESSRYIRRDFFVNGEEVADRRTRTEPSEKRTVSHKTSRIRLFVREVRRRDSPVGKVPILLLHGARVPGIASFDLPVPGGSLAAELADHGYLVYVMDARGYGRSTRPPEMSEPPESHPPLVRSSEVVKDIAAVVDEICKRSASPRVALLGWATGAHWLAYYATLFPERVSHLILVNTLYGRTPDHKSLGHGSDSEDPQHPGRVHPQLGSYRLNTAASLLTSWDRSIPTADKTAWRDPAIAEAYVAEAMASDSTSRSRTPPSFRSPNGALEDSFYLAIGRQLWDASLIRSPTLIIRSERDFWSRPEDVDRLVEDLVHATVKVVRIPEATHFVHLDRAEHGRTQYLDAVLSFLAR